MRSAKYIGTLLIFTASAFISSCSTPYYGHPKTDWENLSDEQRAAIKTEYKVAIDSKHNQKHKDLTDRLKGKVINRGLNPQVTIERGGKGGIY